MSRDLTQFYAEKAESRGQNPNLLFVYNEIKKAANRLLILQGGTRSGKTYSAIQSLIRISSENKGAGITFSFVRQSFPVLESTVLRDFVEILQNIGDYDEKKHRKGNSFQVYTHHGNFFEFFSANDEQKVRGRKRDILFCNEINELNPETYRQLAYRTTGKIIGDFNPSDPDSFVYDDLMTREDCTYIVTTYKNNPFLTAGQVRDIEIQAEQNPEEWLVFGLGQRRANSQQIYTHYRVLSATEWPQYFHNELLGLDFGYNHPSALVHVGQRDGCNFIREIVYERGLTNTALLAECERKNVSYSMSMYADYARPEYILEFRNAGYNCSQAVKTVLEGIDTVKRSPLYVHEDSINLIRELKRYKWKKNERTGVIEQEPIKLNDDGMDAMRYAIHTYSLGIDQTSSYDD